MKKWYIYLMLALVWACSLFGFCGERVQADDVHEGIFDDAGLLTEEEKAELSSGIQTLEQENQIHVLIAATEDTQGKEVVAYADDFFEKHNGDGTSGTGLLLLIDMQHSELYISTSGEKIIQTFTDARLDSILDGVYDKVVDGDFYGGCQEFLNGVRNVLGGTLNGGADGTESVVSGESGAANQMQNETANGSENAAIDTVGERVFDEAELFTEDESNKLGQKISDLETKTGFRILITTTNSTAGRTSYDYSEKFFQNHNDSGRQKEGIVYLINMEAREIYVYAAGNQVLESFSQANVDKMLDRIYKQVEDGNYYKSCTVFLDNVARYGVNGGNRLTLGRIFALIIGSLIIGGVIVFFMARNRGGKVAAGVNNYFVAGGANEVLHRDVFVNRTVSRQRIKRDDDDDDHRRSQSGSSSVHRSSSGTIHGGSGRSFGGGSRGGGRKF